MGTSSAIAGPKADRWAVAKRSLSEYKSELQWASQPQDAEPTGRKTAERYREALATTLRGNPDAFNLRPAMLAASDRLIGFLEELAKEAGRNQGTLPSVDGEDRDAFVSRFVDAVAGGGDIIADACIRRAVCGRVTDVVLTAAGAHGSLPLATANGSPFTDELFCQIYELFIASIVAKFLEAFIAEHGSSLIPLVYVFDPSSTIAGWIAESVAARLPKPCAEKTRMATAVSIGDLTREMQEEVVDRALGIVSVDAEVGSDEDVVATP